VKPWVPLALAIALAGCSRAKGAGAGAGAGAGEGMIPRAETALKVENQNFLDATVYLFRGGSRFRIGVVPGLSTTILYLRPQDVPTTSELQFLIDFVGSDRTPVSESITVQPGDVIELTIPPN
jgi:hypothetical protein